MTYRYSHAHTVLISLSKALKQGPKPKKIGSVRP